MAYNILIGGAAGQGMETIASILERVLKRKGFQIFTVRDYMSRVRGGHNFIQVRFSGEKLTSHWNALDAIIALNGETVKNHMDRLADGGFVICDEQVESSDPRLLKLPLQAIAKKAGNPRTSGSAALGALLGAFGLDLDHVEEVISGMFNTETAKQNVAAAQEGYRLASAAGSAAAGVKAVPQAKARIEAKALAEAGADGSILINGNESIALGALAAGCRFYSAYPMTPSTSIMNYLASKMESAEILVEQAEDEIAAINMAIGASYAGVRSMTGTSGGGFALMVEALGLSAMLEVPLVIAEIQRPGPTTGFPTRTEQADLKFVISAAQGEFPRMVIALRSPEDAFYQTVRAFNLADKYQIPVILLGDQYLADYTQTIKPFDLGRVKIERHLAFEAGELSLGDGSAAGEARKGAADISAAAVYKRYEITETGVSPRIVPGKIPGVTMLADSDEHDEYGHITESAEMRVRMNDKRMRKLEYLSRELEEPEFLGDLQCGTLLLAWGSLYGPVAEAVELLNREKGGGYGALVFGDIWPLPAGTLLEKASGAVKLINVEQNATGQLARLIREQTGLVCSGSILRYDGRPLSSQDIYNRLKEGI